MAIRIVRLGTERAPGEGARLGTVRRPPRGVKKGNFASDDYYDAWLPELAPSAALLSWMQSQPELTDAVWSRFTKSYRREMREEQGHLLDTLALLSRDADFSVGCYCEDYHRCHRSILRELFAERGAAIAPDEQPQPRGGP